MQVASPADDKEPDSEDDQEALFQRQVRRLRGIDGIDSESDEEWDCLSLSHDGSESTGSEGSDFAIESEVISPATRRGALLHET